MTQDEKVLVGDYFKIAPAPYKVTNDGICSGMKTKDCENYKVIISRVNHGIIEYYKNLISGSKYEIYDAMMEFVAEAINEKYEREFGNPI